MARVSSCLYEWRVSCHVTSLYAFMTWHLFISFHFISLGSAAKTESGKINYNATTANDLTQKTMTPLGGFPQYGEVNEDYLMIRGSVPGVVKRVITLRKSLIPAVSRDVMWGCVICHVGIMWVLSCWPCHVCSMCCMIMISIILYHLISCSSV